MTGFVPDILSKFFAAFGIAATLDPFLVIIIDLIYHNYNCKAASNICDIDYTTSSCHCFNGDFVKLIYRTINDEGSGITGFFITVVLYLSTFIIGNFYCYHQRYIIIIIITLF